MVRNADRIVLMKNGNVVEAGTHIELLERKGVYAKLVQEAGGDESNEQNEQEELTSSSEEEESDEEGRRNHLCESEVKERIRRSYKRAFLTSGHLGDAETETLTVIPSMTTRLTETFRSNSSGKAENSHLLISFWMPEDCGSPWRSLFLSVCSMLFPCL